MSRRWMLITRFIAVTTLCALIRNQWLHGKNSAQTPPPNTVGGLTIDTDVLENGTLWATGEQTIRIPVRNATNQSVSIHGFQTSCNCVSVKPSALTILAGEQHIIEVRVDTAPKDPWQVGREAILGEYPIRPNITGAGRNQGWNIRRLIRSPISTDLTAVMFGESNRIGEPPVSRIIRVRTQLPGTPIIAIEPPVAQAILTVGDKPDEWRLQVSPRTDLDVGPFRGFIVLSLPPGSELPTGFVLNVPFDGVVLGGME